WELNQLKEETNMDLSGIMQNVVNIVTRVGLQIVGALIFWIIGRWLIGFAVGLMQRSLEKQRMDATVLRFLGSAISVTLNIVLVVAILGYFGIETTSFAALLAASGVVIGL